MTSAAPMFDRRPVALVTGGTKRVGLAICTSLARDGCDVIFTYRASSSDADAAATTILRASSDLAAPAPRRGAVPRVEPLELDLNDLAAVERVAADVRAHEPYLDVLVHNASIYRSTPLDGLSPDEALEHYRVNALAPLLLTKHLAPRLSASTMPGGGAVVAMLDIHAMGLPRSRHSAYAMSKAALHEMVRSLARELAPRVRVNGVAPGVVAWPEAGDEAAPAMQAAYLSRVPLARAGTPDDAADAVRWLALDARYTTGQVIRIDGGRSMA